MRAEAVAAATASKLCMSGLCLCAPLLDIFPFFFFVFFLVVILSFSSGLPPAVTVSVISRRPRGGGLALRRGVRYYAVQVWARPAPVAVAVAAYMILLLLAASASRLAGTAAGPLALLGLLILLLLVLLALLLLLALLCPAKVAVVDNDLKWSSCCRGAAHSPALGAPAATGVSLSFLVVVPAHDKRHSRVQTCVAGAERCGRGVGAAESSLGLPALLKHVHLVGLQLRGGSSLAPRFQLLYLRLQEI